MWYACRQPQRAVLEPYNQQPVTWEWLGRAVQGTAESIASKIQRASVIGIVCEDSVGFHVLVNALWRCGASVLLISRTWGASVVKDLLKLTGITMLYCNDANYLSNEDKEWLRPFPAIQLSAVPLSPSTTNINDVAMFATTSGTTDNPKCVAIRHRQIRTAYRSALAVHDFSHVRRAASLFPLNGIGVMGVCFLLPREVGAATRIYPPFSLANIQHSWQNILTKDVDFVYLVPPLVRMLGVLRLPLLTRKSPLLAFCASAPVTQSELRLLEERFPVRIYNSYGLTELTFAVFFGCRDEYDAASDSIGYPIGIEARLESPNGKTLLGSAEGELLLKGPMMTEGYLNNPKATQAMWAGEWLRTGDLAKRDAAGRYFICGRIKDVVIRGGVTTYLYELEHYLRRVPHVIDAAAFKGRDLPSGDELCAVVHMSKPMQPEEILAWIREHVGPEKSPNILFVWDQELPRNSNGKVMRMQLSNMRLSGELG